MCTIAPGSWAEMTTTSGSSWVGITRPSSIRTPTWTAGKALVRLSEQGQPPTETAITRSSCKCFNCQGYGHLVDQCSSKDGTSQSRRKPRARSNYGSSSNISSAPCMSNSSWGSRRPPPASKPPREAPSGGSGQLGSQASSTSGGATQGHKRARDPTSLGLTPRLSRRLESPGSPTLRQWREASTWCRSAWMVQRSPWMTQSLLVSWSTSGLLTR